MESDGALQRPERAPGQVAAPSCITLEELAPAWTLSSPWAAVHRTRELAERLPTWREQFARLYTEPQGLRKLYQVLYYLQQRGDMRAYAAAREVVYSLMHQEEAERFMWSMGDVIAARTKRKWAPIFRAEGEAKGLADAVLECLEARGIAVDAASRERIERCQDPQLLKRWLRRALGASQLSEVLEESGERPAPPLRGRRRR